MNFLSNLLGNLNYGIIFFLMMLEGTAIPATSGFAAASAAYHAANNLDKIRVVSFVALAAGLVDSINYVTGCCLGESLTYKFTNIRWGKMCLRNPKKVEISGNLFYGHGVVPAPHPPLA